MTLRTVERRAAVAALHARGWTDTAIGRQLNLSGDSIRRHRGHLNLTANEGAA